MSSEYLFAQDLAGNLQHIWICRDATEQHVGRHEGVHQQTPCFPGDGSVPRGIHNETCQVVCITAFITLMRDLALPRAAGQFDFDARCAKLETLR